MRATLFCRQQTESVGLVCVRVQNLELLYNLKAKKARRQEGSVFLAMNQCKTVSGCTLSIR